MSDIKAATERLSGIEGPTFHGVDGKRHISEREYCDAVALAMEYLRQRAAVAEMVAVGKRILRYGYGASMERDLVAALTALDDCQATDTPHTAPAASGA